LFIILLYNPIYSRIDFILKVRYIKLDLLSYNNMPLKLRVALIWPEAFDPEYGLPMVYGYLKSNTDSSRFNLKLFDCALEKLKPESPKLKKKLSAFQPDVVCVSSWSFNYPQTIDYLKTAKSIDKNIITVAGGVHVTVLPKEVLASKYVDFIFAGEAELSFSKFLNQLTKKRPNFSKIEGLGYKLKSGKLKFNGIARIDDLDKIKIPNYDFINLETYIRNGYRFNTWHHKNAPIWVTRGCPYTCKYCSVPLISGRKIRTHSVKYVIEWIKYLYKMKRIKMINIIDDNFTYNINYAKEICKAIIKLGFKDLHFGTPNGIRIQRTDDELLDLMKKAGWEVINIAPESGSLKTLKLMKKCLHPKIIKEKVKTLKAKGFKVHGFFIIGYPNEKISYVKETEKMIQSCDFDFIFLNIFQPLPGTPAYTELLHSGEINPGFLPKNQTSGEKGYITANLKKFNYSFFILKQYLKLAFSKPRRIFYWFKLISHRMISKKVFSQVQNMIHY